MITVQPKKIKGVPNMVIGTTRLTYTRTVSPVGHNSIEVRDDDIMGATLNTVVVNDRLQYRAAMAQQSIFTRHVSGTKEVFKVCYSDDGRRRICATKNDYVNLLMLDRQLRMNFMRGIL